MIDFETLFAEVEGLQKELKNFHRGLITYSEIEHTLVNIDVIVDILLNNNRKEN